MALRPEFLDAPAFLLPQVIWSVEDVWLSGHLARRGSPFWADRRLNLSRAILPVSRVAPPYAAVIEGADRPNANTACIDHLRAAYGIWGGDAVQSTWPRGSCVGARSGRKPASRIIRATVASGRW